jgi:hypothetical protein
VVPPPAEPSIPLAQARARWGEDVLMAGLFRPGPDPTARTALTRAMTRRSNRKRGQLPGRVLLAVDRQGRALACPMAADAQGGHPEGDDLYAGPFEELGAVASGELAIVALLEDDRAVVLEAAWLDRDAATVAAFLTGDPLPDEPSEPDLPSDDGDDDEPSAAELLAEADRAQARAISLRAMAEARTEQDAERKKPSA